MPSSIDKSAPAENASLPEMTTTPFTAASDEVCFTISSSSAIVVSSSTFIERPGISHVTSAMPSASVPTLKFLKAISRSPLHALDDRGGTHAAADAQRDQRGLFVAALEFVEHGAENHRTGCAERMAERDRAAVDVDLGVVDIEGLDIAQHDGSERLVQLEQVDVGFLHAGAFEQFFGDVDRAGQHHRGLRADIGKSAYLGARLQTIFAAGFLAAEQNRARTVNDAGRIAGVMHVVDALDFRMRLDRDPIEAAHRRHIGE